MAEVKKENWFKRTWGKVKKYFDFVAQVGIDALIGLFH